MRKNYVSVVVKSESFRFMFKPSMPHVADNKLGKASQ